jgi:Fe-S-cluster containining protein
MRCGGHCCDGAKPPVSRPCYERLVAAGVPADAFEYKGYRHLKLQGNGECILSKNGKCSIHGIKPETCRAGPFTFDVKGDRIEIYLKFESICPIVRLLKEEPEAYSQQYETAVKNITRLVQDLPGDELASICRIEEPETELVATIPRYGTLPHDDRH